MNTQSQTGFFDNVSPILIKPRRSHSIRKVC